MDRSFGDLRIRVLREEFQGVAIQGESLLQGIVLLVYRADHIEGFSCAEYDAEIVRKTLECLFILIEDILKFRVSEQVFNPFRLSSRVAALHGKSDQRIHRDSKHLGEIHEKADLRLRGSSLPFGDGTKCDAKPVGKLLLSKSRTLAGAADIFRKMVLHTVTSFSTVFVLIDTLCVMITSPFLQRAPHIAACLF